MSRPAKYGNIPMVVDGRSFSSKKEARRYGELRLLQQAGHISDLDTQPKFPLRVNGQLVCTYIADFGYTNLKTGLRVTEDVKSAITRKNPVYRIKVKLLHALEGVSVVEV